MRIATWNVNSVRARAPRILGLLASQDIDVLAMQETKCRPNQFPVEDFRAAGYEVAVEGLNQWNGVAIASRVGLDNVGTLPGQPSFSQDLTQEGTVEPRSIIATCGGVRVMSVYVPNGRTINDIHFTYKLRFLRRLAEFASATMDDDPDGYLAILGDFNVAPTDADVWDPEFFRGATHVTPRERAALEALADEGMVDVTATSGFTYWDYMASRFRRNEGMRIDIQWASPTLAEKAGTVQVDRRERGQKGTSDHAPLIVDYAV